jgi:RNA polymerase sigma factor (sigma-70 family)
MGMRATITEQSRLVVAAQAGDQRAIQDLALRHLPLVYGIVRRALSDSSDVDDVVQDIMLRALRELPELRNPASFRAWLSAISVRQVSTHLHRRQVGAARTVTLDVIAEMPDAQAQFENVTMLELEVSDQRKALEQAARWLDQDERTLLSLWRMELAGNLTRGELSAAIGVNLAHATVRIQRMRGRLQLSRSLVAALDAVPRCPRLDDAQAGWDGRPSPLWRKRLIRHTRSCSGCLSAADGLVATERLLAGYLLLPVPVALASGLLGKLALTSSTPAPVTALATAKAGVFSQLLHTVASYPVAVAVVTGTVITGTTVTTNTWPTPHPPTPDVTAAPFPAPSTISPTRATSGPTASHPTGPRPTELRPTGSRPTEARPSRATTTAPSAGRNVRPLVVGAVSLESATDSGFFISTTDNLGVLTRTARTSRQVGRQQATFAAVPGLADQKCFSFRLADGRYLRHSSWRLQAFPDDGSELFRGDATFCVRPGSRPDSVSLESSNYPGYFVHRRDREIWVDRSDATRQFALDTSFRVSDPLTG